LVLFQLTYLSEVREEVGPHDMVLYTNKRGTKYNTYLIDVGANDLTHFDEVLA
jgi:flavorubredoxin